MPEVAGSRGTAVGLHSAPLASSLGIRHLEQAFNMDCTACRRLLQSLMGWQVHWALLCLPHPHFSSTQESCLRTL